MDHQAAVDSVVADSLRPLMNSDLSLAFYDMTTRVRHQIPFFQFFAPSILTKSST